MACVVEAHRVELLGPCLPICMLFSFVCSGCTRLLRDTVFKYAYVVLCRAAGEYKLSELCLGLFV